MRSAITRSKMKPEGELPPDVRAPLLCWDLFLEGYYRKIDLADDNNLLIKYANKQKWKYRFDFREQVFTFDKTVIATDPELHFVYASSNVFAINGYHPTEVLRKSHRFFRAPEHLLLLEKLSGKL